MGRHVMDRQAIVKYEATQTAEAHLFVKAVLDKPEELLNHVDR